MYLLTEQIKLQCSTTSSEENIETQKDKCAVHGITQPGVLCPLSIVRFVHCITVQWNGNMASM